MRLQIVCAGVGGRGVLLASTILIEAATEAGYKALASDEYGMSQRGGSVMSVIKVGGFASPLVGRESADILLAFEESEFYRNLAFLKRGGVSVINTKLEGLIQDISNLLQERNVACHLVDGDGVAMRRSMIQASNMAILGFFSALSVAPFNLENVQATIRRKVPGKVLQKNLEVFQAGYDLAISSVSSGDGGLSVREALPFGPTITGES